MTFSRFRSPFLSDLYCSHSEVKPFVKIKLIAAKLKQGPDRWAVLLVRDREVNGSKPGVVKYFCTHKETFI